MGPTENEDLTRQDPDAAARLIRAVAPVDDMRNKLKAFTTFDPSSASQARSDAAVPHGRFVTVFSGMAVSVAVDHLSAWQLIVRGRLLPIYSPMTLLRSALEGGLICRWLVDPRVDQATRVARGVAAQVDDWDERRKFEVAIGAPEPPAGGTARSGAVRLAELTAARDSAGIAKMRFPDTTGLAAKFGAPGYIDISWLYRLVSAFAHAKQWALFGTQLGPVIDTPTSGVIRGRIQGSDVVTRGSTERVIQQVDAALSEYGSYLGAFNDS